MNYFDDPGECRDGAGSFHPKILTRLRTETGQVQFALGFILLPIVAEPPGDSGVIVVLKANITELAANSAPQKNQLGIWCEHSGTHNIFIKTFHYGRPPFS